MILIDSKLEDPVVVAEIKDEDRDPNCPKRFMIGLNKKAMDEIVKTARKENDKK